MWIRPAATSSLACASSAWRAAVNGMAAHGGLIPFGSTFFVFSDYAKPAMRLAALMQLHSLFVYTHDSIAVGEDGPTHRTHRAVARPARDSRT